VAGLVDPVAVAAMIFVAVILSILLG